MARVKSFLIPILSALFGSILISALVPWDLVLSTSMPAGGDNPAHPVLIKSLAEALLGHGSIVHYSYSFWNGFELFQFYFPLPYLLGVFLGFFFHDYIAFKLITVLPIVLMPLAFYVMARSLACSRIVSLAASLLSICFLYTDAHVMWGANIFSNLAGMFANTWGMLFFVFALGFLFRAKDTHSISYPSILFGAFASLSHFYSFLMIFFIFAICGAEDAIAVWRRKNSIRKCFPFYINAFAIGGLISWWALPLLFYHSHSAAFGGNWDISLIKTFSSEERFIFLGAVFSSLLLIYYFEQVSIHLVRLLSFLALFVFLFYFNEQLGLSAFNNVRLWPTLYLSCYLVLTILLDICYSKKPKAGLVLICLVLIALTPKEKNLAQAREWMEANNSGLETTIGWSDFDAVTSILNTKPPSRISYESADKNNFDLKSVRVFEMLPALTPHEIVDGGIVNSASYPGIPYTLQCLSSHTCAGWPAGSLVPEKDVIRSIDMMRALGVSYHIASTESMAEAYKKTNQFNLLFEGKFLWLFEMKSAPSLVETFEGPMQVYQADNPRLTLLALPRFDELRGSLIAFDSGKYEDPLTLNINHISFFNYLIDEWNSERSVRERGMTHEKGFDSGRRNFFLFSWKKPFSIHEELNEGFEPYVGDVGFDTWTVVSNNLLGYSEALIPLLRKEEGKANIILVQKGIEAYHRSKLLKEGTEQEIQFLNEDFLGESAPLAWIYLKPLPGFTHRITDVHVPNDPLVYAGLPGQRAFVPSRNITSACNPKLKKLFHTLELETSCPGKPHLIKYSYFPKWKSNDNQKVYLATNGFMALVPKEKKTLLVHSYNIEDYIGISITAASVLILLVVLIFQNRARG